MEREAPVSNSISKLVLSIETVTMRGLLEWPVTVNRGYTYVRFITGLLCTIN